MANRLKMIHPDIISGNQNAFVPGRQIQDNILVAHEAFHYLKKKKIDGVFEAVIGFSSSKHVSLQCLLL
ncbi:hypothetical protein L3X38_016032 [Prunus dulcis]|uniref:Reverse transcriptase domain-containing protein n=1 Tax=Prunus dulcis TaxID=3755 RepID=A0AAD4W4J8_PRUDU|nr:hypothetical protein L3X38_016032 [Prunus dulcis]